MKKQKILIADDNPHFAKALKFMLLDSFQEQVEEINIVKDGDECLNELNSKIYDTVFMDINMPKVNGIEATREATQHYRNLIVIAVSFHSEMKYIVQMIEAGARSYIIKDEICRETLEKALAIEYSF
ncbi:MAG: response regulator transcription factor [Bacteroidales bacterium]|nr:response regulator transcription factor [Bacteroidales bacterium]MBN2820805.1 response regulator transcription factor [Bacteroidales bacterium]